MEVAIAAGKRPRAAAKPNQQPTANGLAPLGCTHAALPISVQLGGKATALYDRLEKNFG
jgi:hypothetical protein